MHSFNRVVCLTLAAALAGCAGRPIVRTPVTAHKSDLGVRLDLEECCRGGGWFTFGPLPLVAVVTTVAALAQDAAVRSCVEGKGYRFVESPASPTPEK